MFSTSLLILKLFKMKKLEPKTFGARFFDHPVTFLNTRASQFKAVRGSFAYNAITEGKEGFLTDYANIMLTR